ncbi:hypothetical protein ACJVDK_16755 [Pedobacter sp. MW01-1-1]
MNKEKVKLWFKRVGVVGFLFFLIKGLIWLVVFYFIAKKTT